MSANKLPWFRMYGEFIHDPLIEMLAFEDQRHYVFILCMKSMGELDKDYPKEGMLDRVVGKRLGLFGESLTAAHNRLMDIGLIDDQWQPNGWDKRQFISDSSASRVAKYRARKASLSGNDDVTLQQRFSNAVDTDTDTDTEKEVIPNTKAKQPRAVALSTPSGVSDSVWQDFVKLRKQKKAAITQTALDGIAREAAKAGWLLEDALREVCERGWTGFKSDWVATGRQKVAQASYGERDEQRAEDRANAFMGRTAKSVIDITPNVPRIE
jgi:hypothetical protein